MTTRAQYSYGPHLGARPKAAPEFIGATNRASRRRARLAELDRELSELARQRDDVAAQLQRAEIALTDLGRARAELPRTAPVTEAIKVVTHADPGRGHRGTGRAEPAAASRRSRSRHAHPGR